VLAIGRVFLGVHYFSDVAAEAALGSCVAIAVTWLARRLPDVYAPPARTPRPLSGARQQPS
jgi:membrane-associated phospholipid phosphatase